MIRHISWENIQKRETKIERGDKVYQGHLFLGEVTEVKKSWSQKPVIIMSIASHEAKEFIWKDKGLDDYSVIQIIPTRWDRFKAWVRGLTSTVRNKT